MARDGGAPETAEAVEERADDVPLALADPPLEPEQLQGRLREKEQLVAALTERLEQAAEQLDRLRRTGADKGRRPFGAGFPIEVIEDHKSTLEDLKRVISRWEDMQAEATLGRIETQITELRDLVAGSGGVVTHAAPAPPREKKPEPAAVPHPAGKTGGNAWWEAQKAALMGDAPPPAEPETAAAAGPDPATPAPSAEPARTETTPTGGATVDLETFNIPELPPALDLENISIEEARQAIRDRDRIIQQMREPLLLLQAAGRLPSDIQSLAGIPEPLKARIAELETQWQAKFRQVELDLSLERARLAREQAAVRQQQDALQKQLRKGPSGPSRQGADDSGKAGDDSSSRRRWFRFMGKAEGDGGSSEDTKSG